MLKPKVILQELDYVNRVIDQYTTFMENSKEPEEIKSNQEQLNLLFERKEVLEWVLEK